MAIKSVNREAEHDCSTMLGVMIGGLGMSLQGFSLTMDDNWTQISYSASMLVASGMLFVRIVYGDALLVSLFHDALRGSSRYQRLIDQKRWLDRIALTIQGGLYFLIGSSGSDPMKFALWWVAFLTFNVIWLAATIAFIIQIPCRASGRARDGVKSLRAAVTPMVTWIINNSAHAFLIALCAAGGILADGVPREVFATLIVLLAVSNSVADFLFTGGFYRRSSTQRCVETQRS